MKEETKEEYLVRHRKETGATDPLEVLNDDQPPVKRTSFKEKLNTVLFLLAFVVFLWMILQIFGMMKSN